MSPNYRPCPERPLTVSSVASLTTAMLDLWDLTATSESYLVALVAERCNARIALRMTAGAYIPDLYTAVLDALTDWSEAQS